MASLFFSYSHKDEALRNELETHHGGGGITFSPNDRSGYQESLHVAVGEQSLALQPVGMRAGMGGPGRDTRLSFEGAAEFYWSILIQPLQR